MAVSTSSIALCLDAPGDVDPLRGIYAAAVNALAQGHYSGRQIAVWAGYAEAPAFVDCILKPLTILATIAQQPIGFCGIEPTGYVASLYVHPDHARRGIGITLLRAALERCATPTRGYWFAEASLLSRPVFERLGFGQVGLEQTDRRGIGFERFQMLRDCECSAAGA